MGFYTGRAGSLFVGDPPKKVAKIRDWSLETTLELLSTNAIDTNFNEFSPGVKGATGSATILMYRLEGEDKSQNIDAFTLLEDTKILSREASKYQNLIDMELNIGGHNRDDIKFKAFVTSASMSISTGELSVATINFTVNGQFIQVPARTS